MRENLDTRRRAALGDPMIEDPMARPLAKPETRSGFWLPLILGIFVVTGILYYFNFPGPHTITTASNTPTTTTEEIIPPAAPAKPATQPSQTQPATQPQ